MKALRFTLFALAALFVAACLPVTTKNPVGSTVGFKNDPALIGIWKGHGDDKDDKDGYLIFMSNGDGTMSGLLFSPAEDEGEWQTYTLQAATLGHNHILNAHAALKNGKPITGDEAGALMPLLYNIGADGTLTLSLLDEKAAKAAIAAGKIQGTVDPGDMGDAHITAEPQALDAFFASKEAAALFEKPFVTMHRVE